MDAADVATVQEVAVTPVVDVVAHAVVTVLITAPDVHHVLVTVHHVVGLVQQDAQDVHHVLDVQEHVRKAV